MKLYIALAIAFTICLSISLVGGGWRYAHLA